LAKTIGATAIVSLAVWAAAASAASARLPATDTDGCLRHGLPGHHLRHWQCALLLRGADWYMPWQVKHWQAFTLKGRRLRLVGLHGETSTLRKGSLIWKHKWDGNPAHGTEVVYGSYKESTDVLIHGMPGFRVIEPYRPLVVLTFRGAACLPEGSLVDRHIVCGH
jgi:hypothetical protein